MLETVLSILVVVLVISGALIALVAAIGIVRLPDLFTRMHAASKAGTAGSGLALIAVAIQSGDATIWIKCLGTILFLVLTAPVSAHLLAKAALKSGARTRNLDENGTE
ncbi:monovalent cation/H(+) antiporter subunit G [Rhizobium alvei]|uniref:Monovalent cation/H(+) antiporter subunit G n=1 Tax=Rhizobium alvei TaxID=1132659 RepID=A0ABT8YGB8_9HYPH|nr:monovalent cation/H(+) antiporter subunit G [Rhizobium alvei]MDO6962716.1 monovalent cation/H(+) antiporter subunit G [Rhizobium alvei]